MRAELAELLEVYGRHWMITGPCLDGGWYAAPRHDQAAPRVLAATLTELGHNLHTREHGDQGTRVSPPE